MSFFTSSSLSPVAPSPRKTNGAFLQDSDEEGGPLLESEMETDNDDDGQQVASGPGLADDEFEVEAILARKGGYNGKTLMYKIRWKDFGPEHDTWEPVANIDAEDLIAEFERKRLEPTKKRPRKDSKPTTPSGSHTKKSFSHTNRFLPSASNHLASSSTSSQLRSIALSRAPPRSSRDTKQKPLFWHEELPYTADELVIPVSSLVCDAAWSRIRLYTNRTKNNPKGSRKMIVFHPATLVRLRTQTSSPKLNMYFRNALKENVQLIKENELPMLSNGAFPTRSPFRDSALYDIIIGGEPFRLSWPWGIEEPDHETAHIIATLQGLEACLEGKMKCRLLVRNVSVNLKAACKYFGVNVVDAKSYVKGL